MSNIHSRQTLVEIHIIFQRVENWNKQRTNNLNDGILNVAFRVEESCSNHWTYWIIIKCSKAEKHKS